MKNNKLAYSLMSIFFGAGVGIAILFGGVIGMASIALGSVGCVLSYICLSEPKKIQTEKEKLAKEFIKVDTTEINEEPSKVYEMLNSMDKKVTFKGNHKVQHEQEIKNEEDLTL